MKSTSTPALLESNGSNEVHDHEDHHVRDEIRHVSDITGDYGPIPRRIFWFLVTCYVFSPYYSGAMLFVNSDPDFNCVDDRMPKGDLRSKICLFNDTEGHLQRCQSFQFNTTLALQRRSLIDDFSLICHRSWLLSVIQSCHQVGIMIAAVVFGVLSDKFGRITSLKISFVMEIVVGIAQAFSPTVMFYIATRVFMGIAIYGRYINGYVLLIEWLGPKFRGTIPIYMEFGYIFGDMFLPLIFYLVSDYRIIQGTAASMLLIWFLPLLCNYIPESPRWQLMTQKFDEAKDNIMKAVGKSDLNNNDNDIVVEKFNQLKEFTEKELENEIKSGNGDHSLLAIFKYSKMVRLVLILFYSWMSHSFISYASYYNMGSLDVNLYLLYFILSIAYGLSTIFLLFSMNFSSRISLLKINILFQVLSFLGMLSTCFSTNATALTIRVVFAFTSWASMSNSFNLLYIYSAEVFPTPVRQSAMGLCSFIARIGSILAPFVRELQHVTHLAVPVAIYGILAGINLVLIMFLPDMEDKEMPDTIKEVNQDSRVRRVIEKSK